MEFHCMAVRCHVLSHEIPLGRLYPAELYGFEGPHPVFEANSRDTCRYALEGASLTISDAGEASADSPLCISG